MRKRTILTTLFEPGHTSTIRPRRHSNGEICGSRINNKSLTWTLSWLVDYLVRACNVCKYLLDQRRQNDWWHWSSNFQQFTMVRPVSILTHGGTARKGCPIRRWPGHKQSKSCGSVNKGANGREFDAASTRHKTVDIS